MPEPRLKYTEYCASHVCVVHSGPNQQGSHASNATVVHVKTTAITWRHGRQFSSLNMQQHLPDTGRPSLMAMVTVWVELLRPDVVTQATTDCSSSALIKTLSLRASAMTSVCMIAKWPLAQENVLPVNVREQRCPFGIHNQPSC